MATIDKNSVNHFRKNKKKILAPEEYLEGILRGERNILAQAITLMESSRPEHRPLAARLLKDCLPESGNSVRIGITGAPGVGKSTFIEMFGHHLTSLGHKLAVLAIDPSSQRSGGSILGDKTRMESLAGDPNAFIRPSPAGGNPGGVARRTRETVVLCEAAGYDVILIETVGVGQSETTVRSMVDFFLLLLLAGAGDELQGIKRGIMELADGLAVTKADGDNKRMAEQAVAQFTNALHIFPPPPSGWMPEVRSCSAQKDIGVKEIWEMITRYREHTVKNGYFERNRKEQARSRMHQFIDERLREHFYNSLQVRKRIGELEKSFAEGRSPSFLEVERLLEEYFKSQDY